MTDFYSTLALDEELPAVAGEQPRFYIVSRRKMAILYLATLGMYGIYWYYKNWACYNKHCPDAAQAGNGVWPIPRAIFSVFFTHDLFEKIKHHGRRSPLVAAWEHRSQATMLVILTLACNLLDRLSMREIGSPTTDILALLILLPILYTKLQAQEMINASCGDPTGETNASFSGANYAWTIIGSLWWGLILIGMRLPE
ncbi:hypothetical protein G4G28_05900 [Massilia sp. Dwa41.01b]|uniref:hypothetical protein n=1 Tax=unclassified Massilia TaxID=2609279 RepID=UPI001601A0F5|nr:MULTISPECIES: hypothetical protein [unclassified Massilia]QNA88142.1 hypothetical protein G4G28_05900 [Massilia sp. Dwa41.01b]QNA99048.1 hypothetical protein G4G31_09625 [Massilia sp. Se16.2.3]